MKPEMIWMPSDLDTTEYPSEGAPAPESTANGDSGVEVIAQGLLGTK